MDTGGVENPGAVNSRDDNASVASDQELMDTPIEDNGINFDVVSNATESTVEEKDYSFSSKDISKREKTDFFVNVAGAEKRAKKAEKEKLKQERRSRKEMLKEASKSKENEAKERNAKEAAKNREVKHIREKYRLDKFRSFVWRYKLIIISAIAVITLAILAIIFVPTIIENINTAQKEQVIRENKTDMMKVFEQVAGKEFESREEFEKVVKGVSSEVEIEYYEEGGAGTIVGKDTSDSIDFLLAEDEGVSTIGFFGFSGTIDGKGVSIVPDGDEYDYYEDNENKSHGDVKSLIEKIIYRQHGGQNE